MFRTLPRFCSPKTPILPESVPGWKNRLPSLPLWKMPSWKRSEKPPRSSWERTIFWHFGITAGYVGVKCHLDGREALLARQARYPGIPVPREEALEIARSGSQKNLPEHLADGVLWPMTLISYLVPQTIMWTTPDPTPLTTPRSLTPPKR